MTANSGQKEQFRPNLDWKMHIYAPCRAAWSACTYYRLEVPMMGLQKLGLAECFMDKGGHHHDKKAADEQSVLALLTADIDLLYSMGGLEGMTLLQSLREMKSGTLMGKLIYPPSLVYDIDDNLDWVHPYNSTFAFYGTRATDGTLLKPGDNVHTKLADGREICVWQDKVTQGEISFTFDIERNHRHLAGVHDFARGCHGFTTPSPHLYKYMRDNHGYPEGHVFPNSIIPEDWVWPRFAPRKKNIRVLWQGGGSHMSDWFALRPAVKFLAEKYPHVTFVIFGTRFNWITDVIPKDQLEVHEWVPYDAYRPTRAMLDCDINLCVLKDDEFSRSKSAIKFYEGSLGPTPAATLAPDMPPYRGEVLDGETGMLYDVSGSPADSAESFAANLSALIENRDLRRKLGANAQKWVLDNRHYLKTVPALYDYYHELRLRMMKDKPYDPVADTLPPTETPKRKSPRARRAKVGKK